MSEVRSLLVGSEQILALKRLAKTAWPLEACALLFGQVEGERAWASYILPAENADRSPTSFSIEPSLLLKALTKAEEEGREFVGIFHSHPAPPKPSGLDIKFMEVNQVVWLILSMPSGEYAAFQWQKGRVRRVQVRELFEVGYSKTSQLRLEHGRHVIER